MNTVNVTELGFIPAFEGTVDTYLSIKYEFPVVIVGRSNPDYWTILANGGAVAAVDSKCSVGSKHICVCEELLSLWKDELEAVLLHEKGHLVLDHHIAMVSANKQMRMEMEVEADRYAVTNHSSGVKVGASYLLRALYSANSNVFDDSCERVSQLVGYK